MRDERDLVFTLVAAQVGAADATRLQEALHAMPENASESFGQWLVKEGIMSAETQAAVQARVDATLEAHDGDATATLQAMNVPDDLMKTLSVSQLNDKDTQRTVAMDPGVKSAWTGSPDAPWSVPAVQEHAGRYQALRDFAAGGMGKIALVHDRHIGRDVALKTLLTERLGTATRTGAPTAEMLTVPIVARFLQEARVTGQLEHPSIVPVYELGYRADGTLYYTMKFVRGKTLQDVLKESQNLSDRLLLLPHFLNLCQAIAYAHDRGVIHRDLKPLNVMVGEFGETVVIDWGIAKVRGQQDIHARGLRENIRTLQLGGVESSTKTIYGQTIGSPYYMPPEQAEGRMDAIDERSDVYALGALLYHILSGKPPYAGSTVRDFLDKVKEFDPRPIREIEETAPPELAAICAKAMQRHRQDRYPSAKELAAEIEKYLAGGLVSAYEYRFSELFWRFVKKHRRVLTTAGIAAVLLISLGVYSYIRVTQQRNRAVVAEAVAVQERDKAVAAEKVAVEKTVEAQRELYFSNVALTQRNIDEQQMAAARALLEHCPADFRQWEWGYLQYLSNADWMTLRNGGRYAVFTPDGKGLVVGKVNGAVSLCDTQTGEMSRTFAEESGFGYALAASGDGARIAVSGETAVIAWDTASGQELLRFDEPKEALSRNHVSLSADGRMVAALNTDRQARIWQIGIPEPVLTVPIKQAQGFGIYLCPDGTRALMMRSDFGENGWERVFEVLALPSGESVGKGKIRDPLSVHAAAFSPDGKLFALGTDEGLQVWEIEGWKQRHEFPARFGHPDTVAFSPDGQSIAAGTVDGGLGLWNVVSGEGAFLAKAHQETVRAVAFSHNGKWLATVGFDRTARLWETPGLRPLRTFRGHDKSLFAVAFRSDDGMLATGGFDGKTKLWDLRAEVEFAPAEQMIYHAKRGWLAGALQNKAAIWDARSGRLLRAFEGHTPPIKVLAFDDTGATLATVCNEAGASGNADVLRLWNAETGELKSMISDLPSGTNVLAFGNGGKALAVLKGTNLSVRDAASGEEWWNVEKATGFLFSPDGAKLAVSLSEDGGKAESTVTVWDVATKKAEATKAFATNWLAKMAFSPDGARLFVGVQVSAGDAEDKTKGSVHTWDFAKQTDGPVFEGHKTQVTCMAFSPDGATLATGSKDSTAILWDIGSGTARLTCSGHAADILDVGFSPDGRRLVTASQDGSFKLWNTADGREILTLQASARGAEGQVVRPARAQFSPDARQLITLTDPVYSPIVLTAFPWNIAEYPGGENMSLQDRVEQFKRGYWK